MEINQSTKLMLAGFVVILIGAFVAFYGVDNTMKLAQNNYIDLIAGIIVGAIIMYLLMKGAQEMRTPMTAKETFSRFCWACAEELRLPIVEGQVMFNLEGSTLIQKGNLLAYRGRLYACNNDYTTHTFIIDSTIRDPSRLKSTLMYHTPKYLLDKEMLKLMDELSAPSGATQGKEQIIKQMKEVGEVKKAISEEEG